MSAKTSIEWTDATWTPIRAKFSERVGWHCERVSEGCRNCYAERQNRRFGTGLDFKPGERERAGLFLDEKKLLEPLRWKKPRKIFAGSTTDLFADFVPDEWLDKIFAVAAQCPQHIIQILTKRIARARAYFTQAIGRDGTIQMTCRDNGFNIEREMRIREAAGRFTVPRNADPIKFPLPNVWLLTSAEDQKTFDERIIHLVDTPAAVRGVSLEPLLGPIDMSGKYLASKCNGRYPFPELSQKFRTRYIDLIDQVIVGGESGPHARLTHPQWVRSLRDQCKDAGVAFYFKGWGEWSGGAYNISTGAPVIREFPCFTTWVFKASTWVNGGTCVDTGGNILTCGKHFADARDHDRFPVAVMHKVGKAKSGRLLDGVVWDQFPGQQHEAAA
jgi:protein gp37